MSITFPYMFRATLYKMAVWYAGRNIPPCVTDSHLYRVTSTRCCISTIFSPVDGHIVARNV